MRTLQSSRLTQICARLFQLANGLSIEDHAQQLYQAWNLGPCISSGNHALDVNDQSLLVLLIVKENKLSIYSGNMTTNLLLPKWLMIDNAVRPDASALLHQQKYALVLKKAIQRLTDAIPEIAVQERKGNAFRGIYQPKEHHDDSDDDIVKEVDLKHFFLVVFSFLASICCFHYCIVIGFTVLRDRLNQQMAAFCRTSGSSQTKRTFSSTSCAICLEDLDSSSSKENAPLLRSNNLCNPEEQIMLVCGHSFHTNCWRAWVRASRRIGKKTCPVCRHDVRFKPCEPIAVSASSQVGENGTQAEFSPTSTTSNLSASSLVEQRIMLEEERSWYHSLPRRGNGNSVNYGSDDLLLNQTL